MTNDPAGRLQLVRDNFAAFARGDRATIEGLLSPSFTFSSPPDPWLDRDGYFERCWANRGSGPAEFVFARLEMVNDEVLATYEATRPDGTRFRNTEIFAFDGDQIARAEVYFGWNLPQREAG